MVSSSNHVLPTYHSIPFTKKTKILKIHHWPGDETVFGPPSFFWGWIYMMKFRKESTVPSKERVHIPSWEKEKKHRHKSALGGAPMLVPSKNPNNTHHPRIQTTAIELQHLSQIQTITLPGFGGWFLTITSELLWWRRKGSIPQWRGHPRIIPYIQVILWLWAGSSTGFNKQRLQTSRRLENVKLGQKKGGSVVYECSRF